MTDFREIVNLNQFAHAIQLFAIAVPFVAIVVGLIIGARSHNLPAALGKAIAVGLLGPLVYVLWLMYSYLIRYDPQTGYVGLHRVSVLLLNVAIFAAIGVVLGLVFRRVFRAAPVPQTAAGSTVHPE